MEEIKPGVLTLLGVALPSLGDVGIVVGILASLLAMAWYSILIYDRFKKK